MITQIIAIILKDKVLAKVQVSGNSSDDIQDKAFAYADQMFGPNEEYELFELGNSRHAVLFQNELYQLFKGV